MSSHPSTARLSRRQILEGFAAVAASSVLSGCGAASFSKIASSTSKLPVPSQPSSIPPVPTPQPLPIGSITAASLTVAANAIGAFGEDFVGFAYQKQTLSSPLFTGANSGLVGLFKRLGIGVLRVGGSSVDQTVWTPEGNGQTSGQIAPSDIDKLASFLRATGWMCIYGVNLGGSATGATNPALAAEEVSYVSQQLGSSLMGVELGNECEKYGDPSSYYAHNWTIQRFEALWMQYRDAIVAATPAAPLTGPAAASSVYGWTIPFGEYVTRSQINLLTQHYNRSTSSVATVGDLLSPDPALATLLQEMAAGSQSIDVPFRIAECTSCANGGMTGVSNAYASSLWAIDMVFNAALGGAAGVNFNAGSNNAIDTPIADNSGVVLGAQPSFYGLFLAKLAGQGTLLSTQLSAASLNVTSYAVSHADGGLSLLIVNKDAMQNLDLSIALPVAMTSAALQAMTQLSPGATTPDLTALSGVTIQGALVTTDGSFNPGAPYALTVSGKQLSCYVPSLSAVLIELT